MTMQEGVQDSWGGPARRRLHDTAYFLDLLGDSHNGLGRHEAAIEAYRQAAEGFRSQGAQCSYALCLFKLAESHLSLGEPWHALGYLQACLPLLHELGLTRHETLARQQLAHCQAELTGVRLPGREPPGARPAETLSPYPRDKGRFLLCPGPTDSRAG
jgi:tetratricopeptide (TPR) repeat protein